MNRQIKENYIPLQATDMGESHKLVQILSEGQGLIRAAVFGARGKKSGSLRGLIQPFSLCRGDFYYDPVRKLWRLKEGECLKSRDTYHQYLNKYYAALFWSDLIIQTYASGGSLDFFNMSDTLFQNLNEGASEEVGGIFLSALWEFLELEGIQPDTGSCSRCGRPAPPDKSVCYNSEGQVVCGRCRIGQLPLLSAPARRILEQSRKSDSPALPLTDSVIMTSLTDYLMSILESVVRMKMDKNSLSIIFKEF